MANQRLTDKSDRDASPVQGGPIPLGESDLKRRLDEVLGQESLASFSRRSGVPESNLRSYLRRGIKPGLDHLVAIADTSNVSIEWLATGRGVRARSLVAPGQLSDRARLASAVRGVEEGLEAIGKRLPPAKKAELICAAYDLLSEGSPQASAQIIQFIRLAA